MIHLFCKAVYGHLVRVTHPVSNYLLTYLPTFLPNLTNQPSNSMEPIPSFKTNSCSASQAFMLWNPKIHCHAHNGQTNPLHALPSYFIKIHF